MTVDDPFGPRFGLCCDLCNGDGECSGVCYEAVPDGADVLPFRPPLSGAPVDTSIPSMEADRG